MYRQALKKLQNWQKSPNRKPLIICGARQVGKTWLMREFGRQEYKNTAYFNFDNNRLLKELFSGDFDIKRLIKGLEVLCGKTIIPDTTLVILDEVQEVPQALSSLKYFYENAPQYHIICAGSLLGLALHTGTSFPVGKVDFLNLEPLSFSEFMLATGNTKLVKLLQDGDFTLANTFASTYESLLKQYFFVGGMPEVVDVYCQQKNFTEVRNLQKNILIAYEQDFSKHAPSEIVPKIRMLWNSVTSQLTKENKKFIYGLIKEGARAKEYELAMLWLVDCGLIHKVHRVSSASLPLKSYEDLKAFKLFILDVGLLSCMTRLSPKVILEKNVIFKEFKGALTEQYVLQQLKTIPNLSTYYWTNDKGNAELDFVVDTGEDIIPIEVKAETNLKAKSLGVYYEKFKPSISVRTAMTEYKHEDWLMNIPLWGIEYFIGEIR